MDKKNNSQLKKFNLQPLLSARDTLNRILKILESSPDEAQKMGAIQAFEICYELAWHALQKVLKWKGKETYTPRDTFRQAYLAGLIPKFETWVNYMEKRHLTVHTYNEEILEETISFLPTFLKDFDLMLEKIKKYGIANGN